MAAAEQRRQTRLFLLVGAGLFALLGVLGGTIGFATGSDGALKSLFRGLVLAVIALVVRWLQFPPASDSDASRNEP
ncbi:MAG: hypothetical protein C0501_21515 [Isosphaera sp.]|nr:hypothetical protein [Isosphaera sp.]